LAPVAERDPAAPPRLGIVLFSTSHVWGGAEEQLRLLAHGLRSRGHRCQILARAPSPVSRQLEDEGLEVQAALRTGEGKLDPRAWLRVRRLVQAARPDVLLLNDSPAVMYALLGRPAAGVGATVHIRHTCFPMRHPRVYGHVCDAIVCVTRETARICREAGLPADKLCVIHAGSDPARLRAGDRDRGRAALGLAPQQTLLLTVAAFLECKGHLDLLEALAAVAPKHPRVLLALAGVGPLRPSLERTAARLGLAERVLFLGFRRDVPDLLQAADLCVIPSRLEGICSTLVEAMLAGRPVVTTVAGGMKDIVLPGPGEPPLAWTVPPNCPAALAAAIDQALASPEERRRRADRAQGHAASQFTAERTIERFERLFLDLAARSGGPRSQRPAARTAAHGERPA
jgi:glycosyltransferase involved in cell wall biosynthesis